jgi:hypothetical protein
MPEVLEEISAVAGVRATCICNLAGEMVKSSESVEDAKTTLPVIAREMAFVWAVFRRAGKEMTDLDLAYEGLRLLACAAGNVLLIAIGGPGVDAAMLRLVMNIQKKRLRDDRRTQGQAATSRLSESIVRECTDEVSRRLLGNITGLEEQHA